MAVNPSSFNGKYKLVESENFDNYMKALGIGILLRGIGNNTKPSLEFIVNGDQWTIKTFSTFKNTVQSFKLNEEVDEETIDGRKCKTIMTFENGKLVQRQKATKTGEKDSEIIRELVGEDGMLTTLVVHSGNEVVTSKRHYKRE